MANIDELTITVNADARNAINSLRTLENYFNRLNTTLNSINTAGLTNLATSVTALTSAMSGFKAANINGKTFQSLATNINRLTAISPSQINFLGTSISTLSNALTSLQSVPMSATALQVADLAKSLGKMGGASATKAITTIPQLAVAMKNLMTTLSSAPAVSRNVIDLANAMANLASRGGTVRDLTSSMSPNVQRMGVSFKNLKPHINSAAAAFGKFYANCLLVIRAIKMLWSAIEKAMNYIEVLNYFNKTMDQLVENADLSGWEELGYESAEAYANSFSEAIKSMSSKMTGYTEDSTGMLTQIQGAKSLGINATDLSNASSTFAQIASSMGVSTQNAVKLSNAMVELGADLASVKNLDFTSVWSNLQSAVVGMSRTVDKYGVNIRNANLQTKLQELGISASISSLGQEEKALLRVIEILDSTTFAYGDLADTITQPANQVRMLKASMENLARSIGNIFLPVVAQIIPYLISFANALERLNEYIVVLLGFEDFSWGSASSSGLDDVITEIYDADDAIDDTTDSANELKKQLQGFDELNNLTTKSDSGSSSGMSEADLLKLQEAFDAAIENYQKRWDEAFDNMASTYDTFADDIAEAFKTGGLNGVGKYLSDSIVEAMNDIDWEKAYSGAESFGTGLANFLNGIINPELFAGVGQTVAGALNTAIHNQFAFADTFDWTNLGESIASGINEFFDDFDFAMFGDTLSKFAKGLLNALNTALKKTDWYEIGQQIGTFLSSIDWLSIMGGVATAIYNGLSGALSTYVGIVEKAPALLSIVGTITGISIGINNTVFAFNTLRMAVTKLYAPIRTLGTTIATNFSKGVMRAADSGVDGLGALASGFNEVAAAVTPLVKIFGSIGTAILEFIGVSDGVKSLVTSSKKVGSAIGEIAASAGGAITVFSLLLGVPGGIIAGGAVGCVAAIAGIRKGLEEIEETRFDEWVKNAFTNPGGVSISELTSDFIDSVSSISNSFDGLETSLSNVDDANDDIASVWKEINQIQDAMDNGVISVEEGTQKLAQLFDDLSTVAQTKFTELNNAILGALGEGSALAYGLEQQGIDTQNIVADSLGITSDAMDRVIEITSQLATMDVSDSGYAELMLELQSLTGYVTDTDQVVSDFQETMESAIGNIDWSEFFPEGEFDKDAFNAWVSSIEASVTEANTAISEGYEELKTSLEEELKITDPSSERYQEIQEAIAAIPSAEAYWEEYFAEEATAITNAFQTELIGKVPDLVDQAESDWDSRSSGEKFLNAVFGDTENVDEFVENRVTKYQESVDYIDSALATMLDDVGSTSGTYASDTMASIYEQMFTVDNGEHASERYVWMTEDNISDIVNTAMENVPDDIDTSVMDSVAEAAVTTFNNALKTSWKGSTAGMPEEARAYLGETYSDENTLTEMGETGGSYVMQGFGNGIEEGTQDVINTTAESMGQIESEGIWKPWDEHSPSKVAEQDGIYIMQGLQNGIESMATSVTEAMQTIMDKIKEIISNFITDINDSLQFDVSVDGDVQSSVAVSSKNIPKFANGGYPEDGLFYANHGELVGEFSNGRTAVANNEQITSGIEAAVYRAMSEAMSSSNNGSTNVNVTLEGDADGLFKVIRKSARSYQKSTGRNAFA